jgi:hypothetical protein
MVSKEARKGVPKNEGMGAPLLTSNLLRVAYGGLVVVIFVLFAAELGVIPADLTTFTILEKTYQAFFWSGIVLLMVWSWRVTKYLEDVSAHDLTNSPPMAGFGYIIPIMSLWKPYQTVRDIFKASRNPDGWPDDKQASLIGWWWAAYLAANFAGQSLRFIPEEAFTQGLTDGQYTHLAFARLLALVDFVLLLVIVSRVANWLKRKPVPSAAEVF